MVQGYPTLRIMRLIMMGKMTPPTDKPVAVVPPSGGPESSDFGSSFGFVMPSLLCRSPRSDCGRAAFLRSDLGVAWQKYYRRRSCWAWSMACDTKLGGIFKHESSARNGWFNVDCWVKRIVRVVTAGQLQVHVQPQESSLYTDVF